MDQGGKDCYLRLRRYLLMANVEKLSIALTPEMASLVRRAVESGEYATTSEVVREALREWKQRRALQPRDIEELRLLWEEGLASGPGRFEDMDAVKAEARRRWSEQQRVG
jgi:antitoxin ParD1/3/4